MTKFVTIEPHVCPCGCLHSKKGGPLWFFELKFVAYEHPCGLHATYSVKSLMVVGKMYEFGIFLKDGGWKIEF